MAFYILNSLSHWGNSRCCMNLIYPHRKHNGIKKSFLLRSVRSNSTGFRGSKSGHKFGTLPVETSVNAESSSVKNLWKPLVFTIGFSATAYVGCTIWQYENFRKKMIDQHTLKAYDWLKERKAGSWRRHCNQLWNNLSEGQKLFAPILFVNVLVFLAWRVPKFQPAMIKWFASNPAARVVCWPMFLSTFSHYSFFHLAANMYVLHSFAPAVVSATGKEQATFLYLSTGVISSFSSYFYKVIRTVPGLSIGASGAIMGILGYVCTQFPDTKLQIIFLPMFTFTAGSALKFVVGMDLLGVMLGWKFFDHAAHLGGALTGIFWALWGHQLIWQKREPIIHEWHKIRSPSDGKQT